MWVDPPKDGTGRSPEGTPKAPLTAGGPPRSLLRQGPEGLDPEGARFGASGGRAPGVKGKASLVRARVATVQHQHQNGASTSGFIANLGAWHPHRCRKSHYLTETPSRGLL